MRPLKMSCFVHIQWIYIKIVLAQKQLQIQLVQDDIFLLPKRLSITALPVFYLFKPENIEIEQRINFNQSLNNNSV